MRSGHEAGLIKGEFHERTSEMFLQSPDGFVNIDGIREQIRGAGQLISPSRPQPDKSQFDRPQFDRPWK